MRPGRDRPVYRTKPLPEGPLRGQYVVTEQVLHVTATALQEFALAGIQDCGHEGLVLWGGMKTDNFAMITTVIRPRVEHSHGGVHVDEESFGTAVHQAREAGLVLIGQVHSHPGTDARHSDGDDELIALPTEGLLSVVVPTFGVGFDRLGDVCVHQFQDGRWVLCSPESVDAQMTVTPATIDTRER